LTDATDILPILGITSPEKRCGKSLLLDILAGLMHRHIPASNIGPAALFRAVEAYRPALLIDEADTFLDGREELRGIINSGHRRSLAYVVRCVGDDHEPRQFSTWGAKAMATIGTFPPTIEDRAIIIKMKRKSRTEAVGRYHERRERAPLGDMRRRCLRWARDSAATIRDADPPDLPSLHDRANDNWRPLLAIGDAAGGPWPELARQSARLLSGTRDDDSKPDRVQVLADIRDLFERGQTDRLSSAEIVDSLVEMEDRPWPEWKNRRPITQIQLASLLRPFGVRPKLAKMAGEPTRCYSLPDFTDAFVCYVPADESLPSLPSASSASFQEETQSLPGCNGNGSKITEDPHPEPKVTMVTDRVGDMGAVAEVEGLP
jgi:putative DNA primase/helicase